MKECCTCHQNKPLEEFNKRSTALDGRQDRCRQCQKDWYQKNAEQHKKNTAAHKKVHRQRARIFIREYLENHPCVDCQENDIATLDFDHVTGKKLWNVSTMVAHGLSLSTIQKEISKCEIRCANCHRRKTAKQFGWYAWLDAA